MTAPVKRPRVNALFVFGTRPEAIKLIPVIQAMRGTRIRPLVVDTGQHPDMVPQLLAQAGVEIDFQLSIADPGATVADLTGRVLAAVDGVLTELRGGHPERRLKPRLYLREPNTKAHYPAFIVVQGDTSSAFAGALAAATNKLPVVHVEAGLRTGDLHTPFPEEMNRRLISAITALHLPPTTTSQQALVDEGIDVATTYVTGNTSIDAILWAAEQPVEWPDPRLHRVDAHQGPVIVATTHRRENWGDGIDGIADGLARIAETRPDALIVVPMHPNPKVRADLIPRLGELPNVILTEPLEYVPFAHLLKRADVAVSDSGGVQEEAPSLGTPVVVTRESSERMEGVHAGVLTLTGTDPDLIHDAVLKDLNSPVSKRERAAETNPFGDGKAGARIVAVLEALVFGSEPLPGFGVSFDRGTVLLAAGYDPDDVELALTLAELPEQRSDEDLAVAPIAPVAPAEA
ncbi:MAG: UDP-N-acetylglucosamine 2-epimerase (non-hydrolyzing) [Candidatus Nanopelagicales bacterium]